MKEMVKKSKLGGKNINLPRVTNFSVTFTSPTFKVTDPCANSLIECD